jgi:hypothetical protein
LEYSELEWFHSSLTCLEGRQDGRLKLEYWPETEIRFEVEELLFVCR